MRKKTTEERGIFKEKIQAALYNNSELVSLILGDVSGKTKKEIREQFKHYVKSHLFVDDTIEETGSFIFYDVVFPRLSPNIKDCRVVMYIICHRDILENFESDTYHGNRADVISQLVEESIVNDLSVGSSMGIGAITLSRIEAYNALRFYGCILTFEVPNFR